MPLIVTGQTGLFLIILLGLIICSGFLSGSEVAFFSLNANHDRILEDEKSKVSELILNLREKPRKLLATILIANNFVNIAIVIVSDYLVRSLLGVDSLANFASWISQNITGSLFSLDGIATFINFFITVVLVTFILVLFGEVAPKIYANLNNLRFARMMARPMGILRSLFTPLSSILVGWSTGLENRINEKRNYQTGTTKEDLDAAIELTVNSESDDEQEADILKSIIKFGDLSTKQIMKSRVDAVTLDHDFKFSKVMNIVLDSGFSRIPVIKEDFDSVEGILYVKDLLGHTSSDDTFEWQQLVRNEVLYVPESKKIDDLLREFQQKRMHMAIVVNEFGGAEGLVTLEDIMEEVIGDIKDEFDEGADVDFILLSEGNYIFEGKTALNDVCRVIGQKTGYFDDVKGDADSLAGLIIELLGHLPRAEREIRVKNINLKVISVTKRRIEKVNLRINENAD